MHTAHLSERLTSNEVNALADLRRGYHARLVEIENHPHGYTAFAAERQQLKQILVALTKTLRPHGYEALPEPFAVSMQAALGTDEGEGVGMTLFGFTGRQLADISVIALGGTAGLMLLVCGAVVAWRHFA